MRKSTYGWIQEASKNVYLAEIWPIENQECYMNRKCIGDHDLETNKSHSLWALRDGATRWKKKNINVTTFTPRSVGILYLCTNRKKTFFFSFALLGFSIYYPPPGTV